MKIDQSNVTSTKGGGNHMIISTDAETAFNKTQQSFIIKTLNKIEIEGNYLHVIKTTHEKSTAKILNGKRLNTFLLRSGTRQGGILSPLPFNRVLATAIRQEIKKRNNWKRSKIICLQVI